MRYIAETSMRVLPTTPASPGSHFRHKGDINPAGAAIIMNGAATTWKSRRQTTVSLTTAEAEVKACSVVVEMTWTVSSRTLPAHARAHVDR